MKFLQLMGPSTGTLMTLLVIGGFSNLELRKDMTMTGTIDKDGHVSERGGVIEKAKAAKDKGKILILLPMENSKFIQQGFPHKVKHCASAPNRSRAAGA